MTDDEIGLSFFTQHTSPARPGGPSAFGPVDQDALMARIDETDEDDLTSTFFGDSLLDVENAATRAFDIGIRVHGTDRAAPPVPAQPTTTGTDAGHVQAPNALEVPGAGGLADDEDVRNAFILGGPASLH